MAFWSQDMWGKRKTYSDRKMRQVATTIAKKKMNNIILHVAFTPFEGALLLCTDSKGSKKGSVFGIRSQTTPFMRKLCANLSWFKFLNGIFERS